MIASLVGTLNLDEAIPELGPLRRLPSIVSLEDRDYVLAWRVENLTERLDRRYHLETIAALSILEMGLLLQGVRVPNKLPRRSRCVLFLHG